MVADCPSSVQWGQHSTCEQHCKSLDFLAGQLLDSPKRCQCRKYEGQCQSNAVTEMDSKGQKLCSYDLCHLGEYIKIN